MLITRLQARDFRLFESFALEPHPQFNLILGDNGAGKTSVLEAVYVLGRAASHRAVPAALVRDGAQDWAVEALVRSQASDAPPQAVGVAWAHGQSRIRWGTETIGPADLVRRLPVQILDPAMHRLVEEGPAVRRRFLDWGLFHVEQSFLPAWRRSQRALRQRNAALREHPADAELLGAWNRELAEAGEALSALRAAYVQKLQPRIDALLQHLLPGETWQLRYLRGWPAESAYLEALEAGMERDRRHGQTMSGPHRAELVFGQHGSSGVHGARGRISRGQQKLLVCAFVLAQCEMAATAAGQAPVLLVDDFSAELSAEFQARLRGALAAYSGQKFVAALERTAALQADMGLSMFHVEHGRLHALVK